MNPLSACKPLAFQPSSLMRWAVVPCSAQMGEELEVFDEENTIAWRDLDDIEGVWPSHKAWIERVKESLEQKQPLLSPEAAAFKEDLPAVA